LQNENERYDDIVVDDFSDGYYRLTVKTLRLLKWFVKTFLDPSSQPDFLVKTDHDVFVNVPNLVHHLKKVMKNKTATLTDPSSSSWYYIGGHVDEEPSVNLSPISKYYVSPKFWLNHSSSYDLLQWKEWFGIHEVVYPKFTSGTFYMLSGNIVSKLFEASLTEPLFIFEDVFLTGLVAVKRLNLTLSNVPDIRLETNWIPNFPIIPHNQMGRDIRAILENCITLHAMEPPVSMIRIYQEVGGPESI
jgi:hypothetical protein